MCKVKILAEICTDAIFRICTDVFSGYAKEKNVNFKEGTGGLLLKEDSTLAYEEWKAVLGGSAVEIYASSEKGMHNALAKVLEGLEVKSGEVYADFSVTSEVPDMPYRGLSVDLARQKHSADFIIKYIDLCYKNCASHLQLHFTDDESFTLPIKAFPRLSTEGRTYTYDEIKEFSEYAKARGIIIVPEVDIPGHTRQFCEKYPEFFGTLNVLPAHEKIFDAVKTIFKEVVEMFPDSPWIHIGGDEAAIAKWEECEKTQAYMKKNNIENIHEMYAEYIRIVTEMIFEMGRTPVVWEGFPKEYNHKISKDVIVICWESYYQTAYDLAEAGFTLINSSWKPLYVIWRGRHWSPETISAWDPWSWYHWWEQSKAYPDGYTIDKNTSKVIGGQLSAWGDFLREIDDWKMGAQEELALLEEKFPAMCKKLINLD